MNKKYAIGAICVALILGFWLGCFRCCHKSKIAVVDITTVVQNSEQVKALKEEQNAKAQELATWLQNAQNAVKNEKDKSKQEDLLKQYNAEFAARKQTIATEYAQKLQSIDDSITKTISDEAKKKGYQLVIAKNLVIYGGTDITDKIAEIVK